MRRAEEIKTFLYFCSPCYPLWWTRIYPVGKHNTDQEHSFSPGEQNRGTHPAQNSLVWAGLQFLKESTEDFGKEAFS